MGGAFIVAPLLLLASSVAFAAGFEATSGVLGFYAFAALLLVVITLTQILAAPLPRAATVLTFLGVLGVAAGVGFSVDGVHAAVLDGAELVEDGGAAGVLVANVPGLMAPLTWIGIGVALLRAEARPRYSGAALIVAGLLFPVSRIGDIAPLAIAGDALFLLAIAPLGWAIVRGREVIAARPTIDGRP